MKKLILFLVALLMACGALSAMAETPPVPEMMPEEIRAIMASEKWADWTPVSYVQPGGDEAFLIATHAEKPAQLFHFRFGVSSWELDWSRSNALPKNAPALTLTDLSGSTCNGMQLQTAFSIRDAAPGSWESVYVLEQGVWRLRMMFWQDTDGLVLESFVITENRVTYDGWRKNNQVQLYGTLQTDLRYFSYADFDKDPDLLRQSLTTPPTIPSGTLKARSIQFTGGQKYPVYNGPGEGYGQSGGGKAHVSTNDWIQVFGEENGWILIQYDVSRDHMRMGWITAEALPRRAGVDSLTWNPVSAWLKTSTVLTDDPLYSGVSIVTLPEGVWVEWLATMGDWAYVESSTGDLLRGFVPVSALTTSQIFQLGNHPAANNSYPLLGSFTIAPSGNVTLQAEWAGAGAPASLAVFADVSGQLLFTAARQPDGLYTGSCYSTGDSWRIVPMDASGLLNQDSAVVISR